MPEYGIFQKAPGEILTFKEIARVVTLSISVGINKIKITGGEPLVRRDLAQLLHLLYSLAGLKDLSLTTNGILLKNYVQELKSTGLKRLNVSIDTLNEEKFKGITRFRGLKDVLAGIDASLKAGFFVKLNVVIMRGLNDDEILDFVNFAKARQVIVRFIELMPMLNRISVNDGLYMPCDEIKDKLKALGTLKAITSETFGNGPAQYYNIEDTPIIVGFISPISCEFCFYCNRLRLTSDGLLMPCLAGDQGFDLKGPLRENKDEEVLNLIKNAAFLKPQGHNLNFSSRKEYLMSRIGG